MIQRIITFIFAACLVLQTLSAAVPTLSCSVNGGTVTLNWTEAGWVLQEQADGLDPANWTAVAGSESVTSMTRGVNSANRAMFYRLSKSEARFVIYDDALASGWSINGWAGTVTTNNTSPVQGGTASISCNFSTTGSNGKGPYVASSANYVNTTPYNALNFWIHGGTAGGQPLELQTLRGGAQAARVTLSPPAANTWTRVLLPLNTIGLADVTNFGGLRFLGTGPLPVFYVDNIELVQANITPTYALAYSGNGSTGGTAPADGNSPYAAGATVTVLGNTGYLVKTGSTFAGWNTAANGSGANYSAGNTFTIAANTTLYAKWTVNPTTFTVTYNGNGSNSGTAPTDSGSPYAGGATVTVLGNTGALARNGYSFAGWNTAADGTGTHYSAGNTIAIAVNTTLYATWNLNPNTFTVTYSGNGSTNGSAPVDGGSPYTGGTTVTVLGDTGGLAKAGSTFAGWNTAADGSGTSYSPGNTFAIAASITLHAQWTPSTTTFTVTYMPNGSTSGTVPVDPGSPYPINSTVTVLGNTGTLAKTGSIFTGWNTAANGSGTSYSPVAIFVISSDVTLYAQWGFAYAYAPYNQGLMDPQLTGWPVSAAQKLYIQQAEYLRYPGKETSRNANGEPNGTTIWNMVAQTPNTQSWGANDSYFNTHQTTIQPILNNTNGIRGNLDIIMVGDSITSQWGGGQMGAWTSTWTSNFGSYTAINLGIGGDRTSSVLWRLDHTPFDLLTQPPKVCVLQIGNNNQYLKSQGVPTSSSVQGVVTCLRNLRYKFPNTPIIWMNLFPVTGGSSVYLKELHDACNAAGITDPASPNHVPNVTPLDLWDSYATSPGATYANAAYFYDGIHPNAAGYQLWADHMKPLIQQFVGH